RIAITFADYYYNLVNGGHEKLFSVYTQDAILKHCDHSNPFSSDFATFKGKNDIRDYWRKSNVAGSKIMIHSIQTTESLNNSILIVCVGEMAFKDEEDTPMQQSYKFTQTFILVPSSKKSVYDVQTDILTFIPDVDNEFDDESLIETDELQEEQTKAIEQEDEKLITPQVVSTTQAPATTPVASPSIPTAGTSKPAFKTWAGEIAAAVPKVASITKVVTPGVQAAANASTPTVDLKKTVSSTSSVSAVKKDTKKKEVKKEEEEEDPLLSVRKHKLQFLNKKGQAAYPIYIKGIEEDITFDELVKNLESNFGKVDSCKIERAIALVDFVDAEAQKKSIKTGVMKIRGVEIKLEPRSKRDGASGGAKKNRKGGKHHGNGSVVVNDNDGFKKVVK
ncbi:hypothetical protein CANARDRAFT_179992, partial [[Candida] arabinofermentans NRRL YB-2248]